MNPARVVAIVPHRERELAHALARSTAAWLTARAIEVRVPESLAADVGLEQYATPDSKLGRDLDLAVSIGGDGTILATVQLLYPAPAPIVGVNVGQLGYLSELEPGELEGFLPRLVAGDFAVSKRMVVEIEVASEGPARGTWYGLNEAVIEKRRGGHLIYLDVSINGSAFTTYAADGVIIATPTGSTAYTFSVRGPIVSPALRSLVLTPISPHTLFDRSLVLATDEQLEFLVCSGRPAELTIDGREIGALNPGDRVQCRAAAEPLRLASLHPRDFHQILKTKFALPDR